VNKRLFILGIILVLIVGVMLSIPFCFYSSKPYHGQLVKEESKFLSINASFPKFSNNIINKDISAFIDKNITDIKEDSFSPDDHRDYKNELLITYDEPFVSQKFISLVFYVMIYDGGAHPNTLVVAKSYDPKTGKILRLSDLGIKKQSVKQNLKFMVIGKLLKQMELPVKEWIEEGVTLKNLENFSIDNDGLTFHFSPYAVACYAAGMHKVFISFKELGLKL